MGINSINGAKIRIGNPPVRKSLFDQFAEFRAHTLGQQCNISHSLFSTEPGEMMLFYREKVLEEAQRNNIDGRAIAAAITWEYQRNKAGRLSDYLQVFFPAPNMGIGWGSIHDKPLLETTVQHFLKDLQQTDPICQRLDAALAIARVAKIMAESARLLYEKSGGIWINDAPEILAYYFNTGKMLESAKTHRLTPGSVQPVRLTISRVAMSKWVAENLADFSSFKTIPQVPKGFFVRAVGDVNPIK